MSEPIAKASIRYEQPAIVRRETIAGLLDSAPRSDELPPTTFAPGASDVNVKDNIVPVRW